MKRPPRPIEETVWYPRDSAFLNTWFSTYEEARAYREQTGGYLLTYCAKFFVCERGYIESLGLDPDDPRWLQIGFDCARPTDDEAYEALFRQARSFATMPVMVSYSPR